MTTAKYRVISPTGFSLSDTPHCDDYRRYEFGDLVDLELVDAVQALEYRLVRLDVDATREAAETRALGSA